MGGRGATSSNGILGNPRSQRDDYSIDQKNALKRYTKSSSINKQLGITGYDNLDDSDKKYVDNLDKAIARSGFNDDYIPNGVDKPLFVRGGGAIIVGVPESMTFNDPQGLADYINQNRMGEPNINAGYTSLTTREDVARRFAKRANRRGDNGIILEYQGIKKGTRAAYVSGGNGQEPISYVGRSQDESVAQRNLKTMVSGQAYVDGEGVVHVPVTAWG